MADLNQPKVVTWFKIYSGALCMLYAGCVALAPVFIFWHGVLDMPALEGILVGAVLLVMGAVLAAATALPLLLKPRPWLWTYDLVIICLGMTSACCMFASIPLLIFWIRPETKQFFAAGGKGA